MTIQHDWNSEKIGLPRFSVLVPARDAALATKVGNGSRPAVGRMRGKRLFDVAFVLLLLVPLSVVMAVIALVLLVVQGRPVLYAAPRMAGPDRMFTHLKFRTMLEEANDSGVTGAHKTWRITPLGRFLRRTRLDELPQLFNILRGDMSFVGPRPTIREYVALFPEAYTKVLQNRPGVTGLATLMYHRHEEKILARCHSAEETQDAYCRRCLPAKLHLEGIYQRNQSLWLDIWIMWRTVVMVARPGSQPRPRRRRRPATRT